MQGTVFVDDPARPVGHRGATGVRATPDPAPAPEAAARELTVAVHRPWPTVLVVRPTGVLDEQDVPALDAGLRDPAGAAGPVVHVVLDLRALEPLTPGGVRALLELDRRATDRGTTLRLAGGAHHPLLQRLLRAHVLRGNPWCDELLGDVPCRPDGPS